MGYFIAKMAMFYSMPVNSVLALNKSVFFWMLRQSERLEAEQDIRMLGLLAAVNGSKESFDGVWNRLQTKVGLVIEFGSRDSQEVMNIDAPDDGLDPEFDRAALRALKARHGA
jgi:hypothetical protein